jgi:hypothetical protein
MNKPLTFDKFDDRVEALMADWVEFSFEEPKLSPFYFPDGVAENSAEALMRLREARHLLKHEGTDPLEESIRLANTLSAGNSASPNRGRTRAPGSHSRRRAGSSMYKRKATATRLEFEEDDEEEVNSNDPTVGTYHLSKLPRREARPEFEESDEEYSPNKKKRRKSQEKKYQGKRPWSDEEKMAIVEGIRKLGLSKWAKIKKKYDVLFELRTSSQIKVSLSYFTGTRRVPIADTST